MEQPAEVAASSPAPLSPATARPGQRRSGVAMMLGSAASNQVGAAVGALAFPTVGPIGVVAVRQLTAAAVLVPSVHPRFRGLTRKQWWPVLALALVFSVMNVSLYSAIERIGLGLAVTLEFLGPLAVAIVGSRRALDLACAGLAAVGVVVLTDPGPTSDILGVALALVAAGAWACYILLNRSVGQRLPGLHGTAIASALTTGLWLPVAGFWFVQHPPTICALLLAVACGLMSSIVPYVTDVQALRRVSTTVFGTFTSINPVLAALVGWCVLGQALAGQEWIGIGMIVISNAVVSAGVSGRRRRAGARASA